MIFSKLVVMVAACFESSSICFSFMLIFAVYAVLICLIFSSSCSTALRNASSSFLMFWLFSFLSLSMASLSAFISFLMLLISRSHLLIS